MSAESEHNCYVKEEEIFDVYWRQSTVISDMLLTAGKMNHVMTIASIISQTELLFIATSLRRPFTYTMNTNFPFTDLISYRLYNFSIHLLLLSTKNSSFDIGLIFYSKFLVLYLTLEIITEYPQIF